MNDVMNGQAKAQMKVWRPQGFAGVEIVVNRNIENVSFPKFTMPSYDLVVNRGARGKVHYAKQNYNFDKLECTLFVQQPGEVFSGNFQRREGSIYSEGSYLSLYPEAMTTFLETFGLKVSRAYFPVMLPAEQLHAPLYDLAYETIKVFDEPASHIERESRLFGLLHTVLKHCSDTPPPEQKLGKEHKAVSLVKEALHAHPEFDHRLEDLATLTKLNKYYLWEVFKRDMGLSPDQYQAYLRVCKAKDLLAKGTSVVQTALETGFSDQSHLTRVFKKYVQVTPGRFQKDTLSS